MPPLDRLDTISTKTKLETEDSKTTETIKKIEVDENRNRRYNLNDFNNILDIIKQNDDEYIEVYDTNFDDVIDKKDLQDVATKITTDDSISDILEKFKKANKKNDGEYDINGEIDDSKQGKIGDCWLLSGLNSLSYSEEGREIIKNAIKDNDNGSYTVTFDGLGVSYTVTKEDLDNARKSGNYSTGDDDVILMELAFQKLLEQIEKNEIMLPENCPDLTDDDTSDNALNGGWLRDVIFMLTGDSVEYLNISNGQVTNSKNTMEDFYDKIEKNPDDYCALVAFAGEKGHEGAVTIKDINGNDVVLTYDDVGHAWSIKSIKGDYITMVNPWDSSIEVTVSKEEFEKYAYAIEYYEYPKEGKEEGGSFLDIFGDFFDYLFQDKAA